MKSEFLPALAMDIGGSHVTAAAVDLGEGTIIDDTRRRAPVASKGEAEPILEAWAGCAREAMRACPEGISGLTLAMPGPFDYERGISLIRGFTKYESIYGMDIREEFRRRLELPEDQPIDFTNDAQCFLLGECWRGAGQGARDVVGLTLGTGFGSVFMRDGQLVEAGPGIPECRWFYCTPFRDRHAEDFISTRGLLENYHQLSGKRLAGARELAEIAALDPLAREAFERFGATMAEFLRPWLAEFKPECVVIGGNIARAWDWFAPALEHGLGDCRAGMKLCQAKLYEDAALLGAAKELANRLASTKSMARPARAAGNAD